MSTSRVIKSAVCGRRKDHASGASRATHDTRQGQCIYSAKLVKIAEKKGQIRTDIYSHSISSKSIKRAILSFFFFFFFFLFVCWEFIRFGLLPSPGLFY